MTLYDVRLLTQKLRSIQKFSRLSCHCLYLFCQIHEYKNPVLFKERGIYTRKCMWGREGQSLHIHSAGPWLGLDHSRLPKLQGLRCVPTAPSLHSTLTPHPHQLGLHVTHYSIHTGVQWREMLATLCPASHRNNQIKCQLLTKK